MWDNYDEEKDREMPMPSEDYIEECVFCKNKSQRKYMIAINAGATNEYEQDEIVYTHRECFCFLLSDKF
jgi:hypothetical protein